MHNLSSSLLTCQNQSFLLVFTQLELAILDVAHQEAFSGKTSAFSPLINKDFEKFPITIHKENLLSSTISISDHYNNNKSVLDYKYTHSFKSEGPGAGGFSGSVTRGSSGHRMNNDPFHYFALMNGVAKCSLKKMAVDPTGKGYVVSIEDCRQNQEIVTDNNGPINITKRKLNHNLTDKIRNLTTFITQCEFDEIIIT